MGIVQLVQRKLSLLSDDELREIKLIVSKEEIRRIREGIEALRKLV